MYTHTTVQYVHMPFVICVKIICIFMIKRFLNIFKKMKNCTLGVIIYVMFSLFFIFLERIQHGIRNTSVTLRTFSTTSNLSFLICKIRMKSILWDLYDLCNYSSKNVVFLKTFLPNLLGPDLCNLINMFSHRRQYIQKNQLIRNSLCAKFHFTQLMLPLLYVIILCSVNLDQNIYFNQKTC